MPSRSIGTVLLAFILSAALTPAGRAGDRPGDLLRVERMADAMGSIFGLVMYGSDRAALDAAADAAFEEVHRLDRLLSNYKPASEWSLVNREAASRAVPVSAELFDLLARCLEYSRRSDGAFDITVGPLMKVWGFYKGEGALPRPAEVAESLGRIGYQHVRLDAATMTVRFLRPGLELDPGGIGKGYAVDRMVDVLQRHGVDRALLSAAGSSIYGLGAPPLDPNGWRVTISAPGDPDRPAAEVHLKDMSISTSGSYEKFFQVEGRRYSHIIDPRTGYPAQGASAVSVMAPRTIDSEAWTKPYFVNGPEWAAAHGPRHLRVFFCAEAPSERCAWIR